VDAEVSIPEIGTDSGEWAVAGLVHAVDGEDQNDVFSKDPEIRERFLTASLTCEHCGVNRRRVRTVVCRNIKSGRAIQVGSECAGHYVKDPFRDIGILEFQSLVHTT